MVHISHTASSMSHTQLGQCLTQHDLCLTLTAWAMSHTTWCMSHTLLGLCLKQHGLCITHRLVYVSCSVVHVSQRMGSYIAQSLFCVSHTQTQRDPCLAETAWSMSHSNSIVHVSHRVINVSYCVHVSHSKHCSCLTQRKAMTHVSQCSCLRIWSMSHRAWYMSNVNQMKSLRISTKIYKLVQSSRKDNEKTLIRISLEDKW